MNCFRKRLLDGELLYGTALTLGCSEVPELLSGVGYDWLFIDAEHAPLDFRTILGLLQASGKECPGLIRLPDHQEVSIKKALDIGAAGIIVPQVNTADQARNIVRYAKYPPQGARGIGPAKANLYGFTFEESVKTANQETALLVQAEHKDVLGNIKEIVKVEGVDAVFVGPYDLSASFGKAGQVNDPEVLDAIDFIASVCKKADMKLAIFGGTPEYLKPYKDKGFTVFVCGTDMGLLAQSAIQNLKSLKD